MNTETEKRKHRCCFTGHRPESLKRSEKEITADLEAEIQMAVKEGYNVFISGMAAPHKILCKYPSNQTTPWLARQAHRWISS